MPRLRHRRRADHESPACNALRHMQSFCCELQVGVAPHKRPTCHRPSRIHERRDPVPGRPAARPPQTETIAYFSHLSDEHLIKAETIGRLVVRVMRYDTEPLARQVGHTGRPGRKQAGSSSCSMVTGLAQANSSCSPDVAISGLVISRLFHRDTMKEVNQRNSPGRRRTMDVVCNRRMRYMLRTTI